MVPGLTPGALFCLAIALAMAAASPVAAQTIENPRAVAFTPSPDHTARLDDGTPVVTAYLLRVYQLGGSVPLGTTDIGKPPVQTDGLVHYDFSSQVSGWSLQGGTYEARIDAIGPYGDALSGASNAFTFSTSTPTCSFAWSKTSVAVASASGTGSATLSTQSGCGWSAASSASWLTVRPTSGSGSATMSYAFTANTSTTSRTAKIAVGGSTLSVTQSGSACSYAVSPTSRSLGSASGMDQVGLSTGTGCRWTASSAVSWITLAATSGYGSATVKYAFASNTSSSSRTGSFTVGGRTVSVTQAGICKPSLSKSSTTFTAAGGSSSVGLTTGTACTWKATSSASWLVPAKTSGTGGGTIGYTAAKNTSSSSRSASLTIAGITLAVKQYGACSYSLSKYTTSVAASGGTGSVGLTTGSACAWKAISSASWLVPGTTTGTGTATIGYKAAANTSSTSRSASLTIGGRTLVVSQPGTATR